MNHLLRIGATLWVSGLVSCGGGGDGGGAPPPANNDIELVRFAATMPIIGAMAGTPKQLLTFGRSVNGGPFIPLFRSTLGLCSTGSVGATLNGATLPAADTPVPPTGTLAVTLSNCVFLGGATYSGSGSLTFTYTDVAHESGSSHATMSALRLFMPSGAEPFDYSADGAVSQAMTRTESGMLVTREHTVTPAAGATFRNGSINLTGTFVSGSYVSREVTTVARVRQSERGAFNQLTYTVGADTYVAAGTVEATYNAQGQFTAGDGAIAVSRNGAQIGRITLDQKGDVQIEANGQVVPL